MGKTHKKHPRGGFHHPSLSLSTSLHTLLSWLLWSTLTSATRIINDLTSTHPIILCLSFNMTKPSQTNRPQNLQHSKLRLVYLLVQKLGTLLTLGVSLPSIIVLIPFYITSQIRSFFIIVKKKDHHQTPNQHSDTPHPRD